MKSTMFKAGNNNAFTLIEVMIAVFILATAMMGLISTTAVIINGNSLSKMMTTATALAKDKMEQLKNDQLEKPSGYAGLAGGTDYAKSDCTVQTAAASDSLYTRIWAVSNGVPAAGMKTVQVQVTWNLQNRGHNITLNTILAEP